MRPYSSSYSTWEDYSKTLIDAAVPKGLLDYFDFHAYSTANTSNTFLPVRQQEHQVLSSISCNHF